MGRFSYFLLSVLLTIFVLSSLADGTSPVSSGVEFNVDRDPISFLKGDFVSVVCSLTNDADVENAQLEWYDKNGLQITNTNRGSFPYVKNMIYPVNGKPLTIVYLGQSSEDVAGKYKCKATVDGAVVYENELTIENVALLKFTDCPEEQIGILGEESKITCTATGFGFVFSSWSRDAAMGPIEGDNYILGQTYLTIRKTEMSDGGMYDYSATQMEESQTGIKNINFKVYTAPTIVQPILQTTAIVGRSAALFCKAKGIPDPEIEWRKEGSTNILVTTDRITVIQKKEGEDIQEILNFTSIIKEDQARYTCTAKNLASSKEGVDAAETEDELIVQNKPNFKDQGPTTFYNWFNNDEPYITCIANGNPRPTFLWYKGDREITATDNFPVVVNEEDQQPHRAVSKLKVEFDGNNKDAVFGTYRCMAINDRGTSEISLIMEEAEKPPKGPSVTIHDEDAVHIEFWLDGPVVKGPDVTHYKVVYSVQGSPDEPKDLTVAKEYRDHIDTILTVVDLIPDTLYTFNFYAINDVGMGPEKEMTKRTNSIRQPGGLSTAAMIGIVIGIFFLLFIIVDVTCYFKNNCGILMSIREKVGGGREEGYAVAKTEDVENLAKKDELTEEVKAAEEGELAETQEDEKKEPLLSSEEQKVDTVDEGKPEEKKELEPEDKEAANAEQTKIESPKTEQAPTEQPAEEEIPAADADDQPLTETE